MDSAQRAHLQATIARVNGFLPQALEANRRGQLTVEQARLLERKDRSDRKLLVLVGLVVLVGVGVYLGWEVSQQGLHVLMDQRGAYVGLAVGILLVCLGLFWQEYQTDLEQAVVDAVEGHGKREVTETADDAPIYHYTVAGVGFTVSEAAYRAFVDGAYYRAYYLPYSGQLVNLEVLGPEASPRSTELPTCPICGKNDRVANIFAFDPSVNEGTGCGVFLFPITLVLTLLRGQNPLREGQERQARERARLAMLARRPPLYVCHRDEVVFVPGTARAVPTTEIARMMKEGRTPEEIVQSFTE